MADMLQAGSAWLSGQMQVHAAQAVTYRRGDATVGLDATIGRTEFEVFDNDLASIVKVESRDFIVAAADLVLEDAAQVPKKGDQIVEVGADGKTRTYEVMSPAPRTAHWRWSDPYHERMRIHTKLTKQEETP